MIFSRSFISPVPGIAMDQLFFFSNRQKGFPIQFYPIDRSFTGASPVKVYPSIFILKQVRIPEWEGALDFFIGSTEDILCPIKMTDFLPLGCAEINILTDHPNIRCVII